MRRRTLLLLTTVVLAVVGLLTATPALAAAPTITSYSPTSGPLGTSVTINGTGFTSSSTVAFNGVASSTVSYSSSTKLTAKVPTTATSGPIKVSTSGGSATTTSSFTVTPGALLSTVVGPPTTVTKLYISAFGASEAVDVYVDTTDVALITTGTTGSVSTSLTIPSTATPGSHTVTAVGRHSGIAAQTTFLVRTSWAQLSDDPGHRGYNSYENVLSPSAVGGLDEAWRAGPGGDGITYGPVIAAGTVYAGFRDNTLRAFDPATGNQLWSYHLDSTLTGGPAVSGSLVYVDDYSKLLAVSSSTGALVWSASFPDELLGSPTIAGGAVYSGDSNDTVYAVNALTGATIWSTSVSGTAQTVAVSNGAAYVAVSDGSVDSLSAATGAVNWTTTLSGFPNGAPLVYGGQVYVSNAATVTDLRASDGTDQWDYSLASGTAGKLAAARGLLYFGDSTGTVYARSTATGAAAWTYSGALPFAATGPPAEADGVVYFTGGSYTSAFQATYASRLWTVAESGEYYPPVITDGTVTLGSEYGTIVRYTLNGGASPAVARADPRTLRPNRALKVT